MIRSGLLGIAVVLISSFALVGVVALVVIRLWVPAIILGTVVGRRGARRDDPAPPG